MAVTSIKLCQCLLYIIPVLLFFNQMYQELTDITLLLVPSSSAQYVFVTSTESPMLKLLVFILGVLVGLTILASRLTADQEIRSLYYTSADSCVMFSRASSA